MGKIERVRITVTFSPKEDEEGITRVHRSLLGMLPDGTTCKVERDDVAPELSEVVDDVLECLNTESIKREKMTDTALSAVRMVVFSSVSTLLASEHPEKVTPNVLKLHGLISLDPDCDTVKSALFEIANAVAEEVKAKAGLAKGEEVDAEIMGKYAPDINGPVFFDMLEAACVKAFNRKES